MTFTSRRRAEIVTLGVFTALVVPQANARSIEPPANGGLPLQAELVAPQLISDIQPTYPKKAYELGLQATVVLQLTLDENGEVTQADVVESAGYAFDQAAREAAVQLRFSPATRGGQPIPAKIRFACPFTLTDQPQPPDVAKNGEVPPPAAATPVSPSTTLLPPTQARTPAPPAPAPDHLVEVTVRGKQSEALRLQNSAEAVNVIDTRVAQTQSADLGEVLARTQGIGVRRDGGLGSRSRFTLNGLSEDQVRIYLDGVPLELTYPFGIVNVPVNLVQSIEVFRGVVPIRFGADALGGAVNLVTAGHSQSRATASYQVGSFGTHRLTLHGVYRHRPSGFVTAVSGFFDHAKNNYWIDVEIPNEQGKLIPATVRRFHDGYQAYGAHLEIGVVERRWAKRLLLRGFISGYDKELQHNIVMTVPYGEVRYGETVAGATARYDIEVNRKFDVETVAAFSHRIIEYLDTSKWVYDWHGERLRERRTFGENGTRPHDQVMWQNDVFGRALIKWAIAKGHDLRLSSTASYSHRTGNEKIQADPQARDPLNAKHELLKIVSGIEYEIYFFKDRLSNIAFVKDYHYQTTSEELLPGNIWRNRDQNTHRNGMGDSLRFHFSPWLLAKVSYELTTRLPRPDEVFGNGILIAANLDLKPETSQNANFGPRLDLKKTKLGDFMLDINGFMRRTDRQIFLIGSDRLFSYQNLYKATALGIENAFNWTSPGRWVNIDSTLTWLDHRNRSRKGVFADSYGDRLPNRPWLFAAWGTRLRFANLPGKHDTLEPFYHGRYVHWYYRGWESLGDARHKQKIPVQVTHNAGLTWTLQRELFRLSVTAEVDNASNANVFDNFGVQRPGRAYYLKITGAM